MDLAGWDALDRPGRDATIGRTQASGAPLSGGDVHAPPDLDALDANGLSAIPQFAHIRRAKTGKSTERILRRPYNYSGPETDAAGLNRSGLVFVTFQADVDSQYVPIQKQLDELDMLNRWTTPIGSAVFAVLPGCRPGEFLGQRLMDA
jgi:dye decolorizing peroxidase